MVVAIMVEVVTEDPVETMAQVVVMEVVSQRLQLRLRPVALLPAEVLDRVESEDRVATDKAVTDREVPDREATDKDKVVMEEMVKDMEAEVTVQVATVLV